MPSIVWSCVIRLIANVFVLTKNRKHQCIMLADLNLRTDKTEEILSVVEDSLRSAIE